MRKFFSAPVFWAVWMPLFLAAALFRPAEVRAWQIPGTVQEATLAVELVKILNQERQQDSLRFLALDSALCDVADYEAAILTRNLSPEATRHPNLNKPINLSVPLRQFQVSGQAVGVLRVFSNLEPRELIMTMSSNLEESKEMFYEKYTGIGVRVREMPSGQKLMVFVFSTGPIDLIRFRKQVCEIVNAVRQKAGLNPVAWSDEAARAAQIRAREIEQKLSHTRPSGRSWSTVVTDEKIAAAGSGENIAAGQRDPRKVMNDWLSSREHRTNILKRDFNRLGVGLFISPDGRLFWTQLFLE
ncbi:MAG: CAP domain-containing protein [Deltaproteobacteria bacterium]|jgi:uncharacterized protein YkwD|nr:CAP domain-containing protein [Deltaproteobacteria bacterium]